MTLLEDDHGLAVRVAVYNAAPSSSTPAHLRTIFPKGAKVAIKEPYFKESMDGSLAIRVENPANVVTLKEFPEEKHKQKQKQKQAGVEVETFDLEEERSKGNKCFQKQDWQGAVAHYTKCIDAAALAKKYEGTRVTLLFSYSNRAESWLRMGQFERALHDSNKALEIDAAHLKTLYRKARALHGLRDYWQEFKVLIKAAKANPRHEKIQAALRQAKLLCAQSQKGQYDISDFLLGGPPPAELGDFIGSVEIKMTEEGRGRGVFATKNIETGEILMVSTAVFVAHDEGATQVFTLDHRNKINTASQEDLVVGVIDAAGKSQKLLRQLYALDDGSAGSHSTVPTLELFRTGGQCCQETAPQVDVTRIRDIIAINSFGGGIQTFAKKTLMLASNEDFSGLWLLPSFINHSCLPNTGRLHVGNAMFLHACKPIKKGEELAISYFDSLLPFPLREAKCQAWGFNCKCQRCMVEQSLKEALDPIMANFEDLHDKVEETIAARSNGEEFPTDLPKYFTEFADIFKNLENILYEYPRLKVEEKN